MPAGNPVKDRSSAGDRRRRTRIRSRARRARPGRRRRDAPPLREARPRRRPPRLNAQRPALDGNLLDSRGATVVFLVAPFRLATTTRPLAASIPWERRPPRERRPSARNRFPPARDVPAKPLLRPFKSLHGRHQAGDAVVGEAQGRGETKDLSDRLVLPSGGEAPDVGHPRQLLVTRARGSHAEGAPALDVGPRRESGISPPEGGVRNEEDRGRVDPVVTAAGRLEQDESPREPDQRMAPTSFRSSRVSCFRKVRSVFGPCCGITTRVAK